jgi:hypothetical protein
LILDWPPKGEKAVEALVIWRREPMLDHMILTVSNVERSLAFYEAALKPLNIKFFLPYKGEGDHPDLWGFGDGKRAFFWIKQGKPDPASIHWGFMAENNGKVDEFYRAAYPLVAETIFHRGHEWNTIRDTTPPIYLTRTGIPSRSSIRARALAFNQRWRLRTNDAPE